jgi:flagellar biosynthesis protein FlhG
MPALGPRTEYTGALLRQIREALGIELREITERTKIGLAYLVSLEAEQFPKLPATVYVRGFLGEYARLLGLDSRRVVETYLERYRAARGATAAEVEDEDSGAKKK